MKKIRQYLLCNLKKGYLLLPFLAFMPLPGSASTIDLSFNSLPSSQGWSYVPFGINAPETSIFSVTGTSLIQNTIGIGFSGQGHNLYALDNIVDPLLPYTLRIRARVLQDEGNIINNTYGFFFGVGNGTETFNIAIGTERIQDGTNTLITDAIDTTVFHDYKITFTPNAGYDFFIDNLLISSELVGSTSGNNKLTFGDGTGGTNTHSEISFYSFSQMVPVLVPVPSTIWLFGSGLIGFVWVRRKTSQSVCLKRVYDELSG